ncbi:MAG: MFS transporter [Nocardioidaceae bacterium]
MAPPAQPESPEKVTYRDLFGDREFASLWIGDVLSRGGSQIGQFAIAALVYDRTGSPALTATAFAVSYLPHLLGGAVLATLADRWPRRETLVVTDVIRAMLIMLILIPGMPVGGVFAVIFTVELVKIPFGAARLAILADILHGQRFAVGNGLVAATQQVLMVVGFAGGGFLVSVVGPRPAIAIDAVTYLVSAAIIRTFVRQRPAPVIPEGESPSVWSQTVEGLSIVRRIPGMSANFLLLMVGPASFSVLTALAVPYAHVLGGGDRLAGVMMASGPLGAAIGMACTGRLDADRRGRLIAPSILAMGILLAFAGVAGGAALAVAFFFLIGLMLGYITTVQAAIAATTPTHARGRIFGLGNTVMQLSQGVSVALTALFTEFFTVGHAFVVTGALTTASASLVILRRREHRARHPSQSR